MPLVGLFPFQAIPLLSARTTKTAMRLKLMAIKRMISESVRGPPMFLYAMDQAGGLSRRI